MIVDERTYQIVSGKMQEFLELYEKEGLAVQMSYLGKPFGYFTVEVGEFNHVVHMWAYDSMADREQKRERLFADAQWKAFLKKAAPYFARQENRLLRSAPFFPVK